MPFPTRPGRARGRVAHVLVLALMLVSFACNAPRGAGAQRSLDSRVGDAEAAGLLLLAGNVEIAYGRVAAARTYDAAVLAYAARVRTDHAAMNAALADAIASARIVAIEGARADRLRTTSAERRALLETLIGRAFDVGYLDAELRSQRELLALLDQVQGSVARGALREHLAALRPVVAAHAAHAEQLRGTLTAR
jgi:predicted outer membrane protein